MIIYDSENYSITVKNHHIVEMLGSAWENSLQYSERFMLNLNLFIQVAVFKYF